MMNFQGVPICLEAIGVVRSLPEQHTGEVTDVQSIANESHAPGEGRASMVQGVPNTADRFSELVSLLSLPTTKLFGFEVVDLKTILSEFSDVFAFDDCELGCTKLLQHHINTRDHAPPRLKQLPYRTPFVRRAQISSMVDQMQEQGIMQP